MRGIASLFFAFALTGSALACVEMEDVVTLPDLSVARIIDGSVLVSGNVVGLNCVLNPGNIEDQLDNPVADEHLVCRLVTAPNSGVLLTASGARLGIAMPATTDCCRFFNALATGKTQKVGVFTCLSETDALTCTNETGNGFRATSSLITLFKGKVA